MRSYTYCLQVSKWRYLCEVTVNIEQQNYALIISNANIFEVLKVVKDEELRPKSNLASMLE